ncbi:MAG: ABC transporter substrate-binding protein [Clostridia bacterium]|nr:ABC transporter substrate-binding protein [Clostridia bacterium]MBR5902727.1 ABC transporter substrate-binding protein [Clostridia bacterium]
MKKLFTLIALLEAAMLVFSACADTSAKDGSIKITDMVGREITLDGYADKIVALQPSDCEILYSIGAGSALVGRGEYCNYPAEIADVPAVQSGSETNIEQIIALAPDVVIMSKMSQSPEQVEALENAGIPVFMSDVQDIAGIYVAIEKLGLIAGKQDEAASVISDMKAAFDDIRVKSQVQSTYKTIYFETSPLEWGLWTAGKDTFMQEIADLLCVKNIFDDVSGWVQVSAEQVIDRNPDYIVTTAMYFGTGMQPDEEVKSRDGWGGISAIANNNVFNANSDELTIPSVRLVLGAQALYNFIYGN